MRSISRPIPRRNRLYQRVPLSETEAQTVFYTGTSRAQDKSKRRAKWVGQTTCAREMEPDRAVPRVLARNARFERLFIHGFVQVKQRGSHPVMRKKEGYTVNTLPVPDREWLGMCALRPIIRQSGR